MPHPDDMRRALSAEVATAIYDRAVRYVRQGRVRSVQVGVAVDGVVRITGEVHGTEPYETECSYNQDDNTFYDLICTCPYEYHCKHAVALGLAYINAFEHAPTKARDPAAPLSEVREALEHAGLDIRSMPEELINQLLLYRGGKPTNTATQNQTRSNMGTLLGTPAHKRSFNPNQYAVLLHRHRTYAPSFHHKGRYYERAGIADLLKNADLTETQHALLTYIKAHDGFQYSPDTTPSEVDELFPLLVQADIPIVCGEYYDRPREVMIDLDPKALQVGFVHYVNTHPGYEDTERHEIHCTLPDEHEPGPYRATSSWLTCGDSVVHETDTHLSLYTLGPEWARIVGRMQSMYRDLHTSRPTYMYHGTRLTKDELGGLHRLLGSVPNGLVVSVPEPVRNLVVTREKPTRTFVVELDTAEKTLHVVPALDYGVWQSNIAESISRRAVGRQKYVRKNTFEHNGEYVIVPHDNALHFVHLSDKEEVAFYKELEKQYLELGFTKTLKCARRGNAQLQRYITEAWPVLRDFAQHHGYSIIFPHDTLPSESVSFSADFTSDVDAEHDWLHFDVDLYCAGERVTLDALYRFMESGETYWRKDDGTLVEVENRAELERLVRLLRSFRAREEGGFEGKLHHAPELSYVMTSSPHYSATQSKSLQAFMKRIESGKPVKKVRLPKKLNDTLRPYQRAGVEWLYFLRSYHFAGILADDMGLGKTLQALTVIALERVPGTPSLVVCPKSLLYNWKNEAATFFPDLKVLVYDGLPDERATLREDLSSYDLVVVGYATLKRDADTLVHGAFRYNYALLDEAQYIKNHATKLAQTVKEIPADYRLALTGTPLENHVFELWSIYDYLMPGFLGKHDHFNDHFHKPIMEHGDEKALLHLRKKVESFMLRRTKSEVLAELPPKVEQTRECTLTDAQNVLYQQILTDVRGAVFTAIEAKGFKGSQIHILAGLTKLRQACNHPALLTKDPDHTAYESAKLDACMELIEEVRQSGRKVLVFSQFTGMLDILADTLAKSDITYTYLSGKTRKRQDVIKRFNTDPAVTAFLISMKAGGVGLNLTAADTVIIFDPWWNPSVENQAVDRAHRIGQTQSVNVYRLLTKGTIEDKIQALKRKKQNLFDAVVDESGELFKKLTWEDLKELFSA